MNFDECFEQWVLKEEKAFKSRKRFYAHFDPKIRFDKEKLFFKKYFSNPKNTSIHSFYPFIRFDKITRRIKTDKETGKREVKSKTRPLMMSAHLDSFIYSWYSNILNSLYETKILNEKIDDSVLAYLEKGKSNIDFAHETFSLIKNEMVVLTYDITGFFDYMDHSILKKKWIEVLALSNDLPVDHYKVFKSLTNYSFVKMEDLERKFPQIKRNRKKKKGTSLICNPQEFREKIRDEKLIYKNEFRNKIKGSARNGSKCGIPQGSPISATLSNIYMLDFDRNIKRFVQKLGGVYRRYSDDILVIVNQDKYFKVDSFIKEEIQKNELELNNDKSEVRLFSLNESLQLQCFNFDKEKSKLQYLGFEFDGQNVYVRSSSFSKYNRRLNSRIRESLKSAYGKKSIGDSVFKKRLYRRYTEIGKRNFISYVFRASETMSSETLERQAKNNVRKVKRKFFEKKIDFESRKNIRDILK